MTLQKYRSILLPLAATLLVATAHAGDMAVIVNAHDTALTLDRNQIRNIFLGRISRLPNGDAALPLDQRQNSPLREVFYTTLTNLSAAQAKAQWAKLFFTGRAVPPVEYASSEEVKRAVVSTPGAIGYIEKSALDPTVRALLIETY